MLRDGFTVLLGGVLVLLGWLSWKCIELSAKVAELERNAEALGERTDDFYSYANGLYDEVSKLRAEMNSLVGRK